MYRCRSWFCFEDNDRHLPTYRNIAVMNDKFLKQMEQEYDHHSEKGNLFKVRHLKVTIQDAHSDIRKAPKHIKEDYSWLLGLEKRLIDNSIDGYGFDLNKHEMTKCNSMYKKYKIA